jgi:hypothetical protein
MKNCNATEVCKITDSDLKLSANDTSALKKAGLAKQDGPSPIKQFEFPVICSKDPSKNDPSKFFSDACVFLIGIQGESKKAGASLIKYELSLEDGLDSHIVNKNHFTYIQ